jgi:ketosteroid isomerase-like protein
MIFHAKDASAMTLSHPAKRGPTAVLMAALTGLSIMSNNAHATPEDDKATVARLDTEYQLAVKRNDEINMGRILADDFVLISGGGQVFTRAQLLEEARKKRIHYEQQDEITQVVRVWGDTAVVTALLWLKGTDDGKPFDRKVWFSDTYARTPAGWKYVLGQVGRVVEKDGKEVKP